MFNIFTNVYLFLCLDVTTKILINLQSAKIRVSPLAIYVQYLIYGNLYNNFSSLSVVLFSHGIQ